jgi:hypothetical protein
MARENNYVFYITTNEGEDIIWEGLTEIQAFRMDRTTRQHAPSNILRYGWGKDPTQGYLVKKARKNESTN